jgi:DNA repair ATPase RecN
MTTASEVLQRFDHRRLARDAAQLAVTTAEQEVDRLQDLTRTAEEVRMFFTLLADQQRKDLEQKVEALVDYGVQSVFGPTYRFKVTSELRGKSVRTEFWLVEDGLQLPLLDATGGGVGDVVSFLLRVVILCLARPVQRRVLVLDEPFKFVSASHFVTLSALLQELSTSLGIQLIMVTHKPELLDAASTIIRVQKTDAGSVAQVETV